MQLTLGAPAVAVLACIGLGVVYAALLYFRDRRFKEVAAPVRYLMAGLRGLFVAVLAFFLLEPFLRFTEVTKETPLILIAQDVSRSIEEGDARFDYTTHLDRLEGLSSSLEGDYEVRFYSFGTQAKEGLQDSLNEPLTDYSALLREWTDRYTHRNVGALIIATDGRFNRGSDPRYRNRSFDAPTFTIALGDTAQRRDAFFAEVRHNDLAFLGNRFPIQAVLRANALNARSLTVRLLSGDRVLEERTITPDQNRYTETLDFELSADRIGLRRYTLSIEAAEGEQNTGNNRSEFYIEVIDSRQQILLLASSPHPDLAALRSALEQNERYEVRQAFIGAQTIDIDEFNLLVLHRPDFKGNEALWSRIQQSDIPVWTFTGAQVNGKPLASWQPLISIAQQGDEQDEVLPEVVGGFASFQLSNETYDWFRNVPPLKSPFGEYQVNPGTEVLLQQRVGSVATDRPMVAYGDRSGRRWAVVMGEGIWRWRLADYQVNQSHEHFDDWILRSAQYLASSSNRSRFRVSGDRLFDENQNVALRAEVYNAAFQPITEPEVRIELTDEEEKSYAFTLSRRNSDYVLNAGVLPVGNYTWEARTDWNGSSYVQRGAFTVRALEWEQRDLQADHALLQQWAEESGGVMVSPSDIMALEELIRSDASVKPVLYEQSVLEELIEQRVLFFILLALIALEWFLRKRNGGY